MKARRENKQLEAELLAMLGPRFPDMTVTVEPSDRWDRLCVRFCWSGFAGLLPEERFHRLTSVIDDDFRTSRMEGVVWLELAPGETVEQYLELPRSEDLGGKEHKVCAALARDGFFDRLGKALGPSPEVRCGGDFALTTVVLSDAEYSPDKIRDAKLLFIRHGVYCDCQVVSTAQSELAKVLAGAA